MSPHLAQYRSSDALDARTSLHRRYTPTGRDVWDLVWRSYPLRAGDKVLEVGCGSGGFWLHRPAAAADLDLTLTDASKAMLDSARERLRAAGLRARYERAAVERLPHAEGTFDVAISHFMLYHVVEKEEALRQMLRVCRPGGWVGIVLTGPDNMSQVFEIAALVSPSVLIEKGDSMRFTSVHALPLLASVFESVDRADYRFTMEVDDPDALVRYAQSCPTLPAASEARFWSRYRAVVEDEIARRGAVRVTKEASIFRCEGTGGPVRSVSPPA